MSGGISREGAHLALDRIAAAGDVLTADEAEAVMRKMAELDHIDDEGVRHQDR